MAVGSICLRGLACLYSSDPRFSGFRPKVSSENYSDVYVWYTSNNEEFQEFAEWYSTGEKVFPEDIDLTPTVLKYWYVCDGSLHQRQSSHRERFTIGLYNEIDNKEKIKSMFLRKNLPEPSFWTDGEAYWNVNETEELFEYIGKSLPGFEYKWPKVYR